MIIVVDDTGTIPGGWTTTATPALNTNSSGYTGLTARIVIPTAGIVSGSKIRFTLKSPPGNSMVIAAAACQQQAASGDVYDFSTTPVAVLFSGSTGVTIAAGASLLTDDVTMAVSGSSPFVLAIAFTTASNLLATSGLTGYSSHYISGNRASIVNEGAMTALAAGWALVLSKIEVFSP